MNIYFLIILLFSSYNIHSKNWEIIPEQSSITFSATHVGREFTGTFNKWTGKISFDPKDLQNSMAIIEIDLASVDTKNNTYNSTLSQSEWFDIKNHPKAIYKTTGFEAKNNNLYDIKGELTIKSISYPVIITNAQIDVTENTATLTGQTLIHRLDYDIGKSPDPNGAWVSLDIPLILKVQAKATKD